MRDARPPCPVRPRGSWARRTPPSRATGGPSVRHFPVPLRLAAVLAATLAGTGCMNVGEDPAGSTSSGATAGVAHESPDGGTGTLRAVPQGGGTPGRARPGG
ncbi:hypothetical protein GTY77_13745, partial [Streptomyces sp. SID8380]|nr:hypothetical protein [Streptomyces sp. SID8380]